jgi:hypothetical protein
MSALTTEEPKPEEEKPAAAEPAKEGAEGEGEEDGEVAPEEEATAVFKALVTLDEVDVVSGEEGEDALFSMRGKLYRYTETLLDKGSGKKQWIERGVGEIKLLK